MAWRPSNARSSGALSKAKTPFEKFRQVGTAAKKVEGTRGSTFTFSLSLRSA